MHSYLKMRSFAFGVHDMMIDRILIQKVQMKIFKISNFPLMKYKINQNWLEYISLM